jgi:hypothetical protein
MTDGRGGTIVSKKKKKKKKATCELRLAKSNERDERRRGSIVFLACLAEGRG